MTSKDSQFIADRYQYDGKLPFSFPAGKKEKIKEFEDRISLQNRPLDDCYICKTKEFIKIGDKDKYGFYYPVRICKKCSLVQANPYYSDEEVNIFYSEYFRDIYMGTQKTQKYIFNNNMSRGEDIISFIEEQIGEEILGKNVLDIGCGNGGILNAFKNKGNNCLGIDLGSTYFNEGLKSGLDLRQTSLKGLLDSNEQTKFDIVIFSHNLEHLINPLEELELLKKVIHKDSMVFISVPGLFYMKNNNYDYVGEYFQNAHKSHFSLNTLSNLMTAAGYNLMYGDEEIRSIFQLSNQKQEQVFEDYKDVFHEMSSIEDEYKKNIGRIMFMKSTYFILDKVGLRIFTLRLLKRVGLTKILRKIILHDNGK